MKKILIVDDSKMIIELLEKALFKTIDNIEILEASTYKEGLKYILRYGDKIDVAILDLKPARCKRRGIDRCGGIQ